MMSDNTYSVARVNPANVKDAILALWRGNLGAGVDAAEKFEWLYGERALTPGNMYVLHCSGQTTPVGAYGLVPRRFRVGNKELAGAVLSDLVVDKAHRTLYPAMLLQKTVLEDGGRQVDLIYGFPNANAKPLFRRLGYRPLGSVARYVRVLDSTRLLKERLGAFPGMLAAPFANLILQLQLIFKSIGALLARPMAWSDVASANWDLDSIKSAQVQGARSVRFLEHRFHQNPRERYQLLELLDRVGDFCGYAVVYARSGIMYVDDLYVSSGNIARALLALAKFATREHCGSIQIELMSTPAMDEAVREAGFVKREAREIYYFIAGDNPLRRDLSDGLDWYITSADEDQ